MAKDVNTDPVVTDTGVVESPAPAQSEQTEVATVKSETAPVADDQQAASQVATDDKGPVPYDRFSEVNAAKKTAEGRVVELENYIQLQKANPPAEQPVAQQPSQSLTMQVIKDLGYQDEAFLSVEQTAQVNDRIIQITQASAASDAQLTGFKSSHTDFAQVVGALDPTTQQFVHAPPLQRAIQRNPGIQQAINSMSPANAAVMAYEIASRDVQYVQEVAAANKPVEQQNSEQAQQVLDQANSQVSISAVAGVGTIDKAAQIRAMSDDEFEAHKQKIMAGSGTQ